MGHIGAWKFTVASCIWTSTGALVRQTAPHQLNEEWRKHTSSDGLFESDEELQEYMKHWREYDYLPAVQQLQQKEQQLQQIPFGNFRRSFPDPFHTIKAFVGKEQGTALGSSCPELAVVPNGGSSVQDLVAESPMNATSSADSDDRQYVFITGGAYTGTTGVLGLLSTSPRATNLCDAHSICCEGGWLLNSICEGRDSPGDPNYPQDWNDAIEIFNKYWNQSQQIFLDKSPSYLFKFSHVYKDLQPKGMNLSFIYVISSVCSGEAQKSPSYEHWGDTMEIVVREINELRSAGARVHVIKTEDLLGNPLGVTRALLDFLPQLGSLDPTKSGVHDAPYVMDGDVRAQSVADYIASKGEFPKKFRTQIELSNRDKEIMTALGYTEDWYNQPFIVST